MWVINSVSNTLTSVLTLVKVPLSGVRLVNLELTPLGATTGTPDQGALCLPYI